MIKIVKINRNVGFSKKDLIHPPTDTKEMLAIKGFKILKNDKTIPIIDWNISILKKL